MPESAKDASESLRYEAVGGNKLAGTTRKNLIETYRLEERGGRVYFIDAHKRVTAHIIESRYDTKEDTEANVWTGHYVGVWTANQAVVEDVEESIPDEETLAEIRAGKVKDSE